MRYILFVIISHISILTIAQSFGVSDTLKILSKTTDFGTMHDFIQLENYSGKDLNMRWKQSFSAGFPSNWIPSIQDPDNWYNPCDTIDSADFVLPDSVSVTDKMVIGLDHQQTVGAGTIYYQLFPIDDPTDTINIAFSINVSQGTGTTAISEYESNELEVFPNPMNDKLWIRKTVDWSKTVNPYLLNINGVKQNIHLEETNDFIILHKKDLPSGIYYLQVISPDQIWVNQIIIL